MWDLVYQALVGRVRCAFGLHRLVVDWDGGGWMCVACDAKEGIYEESG